MTLTVLGTVTTLLGTLSAAQAQNMRLIPTALTGPVSAPITLDVVVTGNMGSAVSWGTIASLSDPLKMNYAPNYSGTGLPYISKEPFFDLDFTDTSSAGNGILSFNFLNSTPGQTFPFSQYTPLSEFQVQLGSVPSNTILTVSLAPLGIPPLGSAVQDDSGNNILLPADPNAPLDNVATAYIIINNGNWLLSPFPPVVVPEPAGWLTLLAGVAGVSCLLRRSRKKSTLSNP